MADNRDGPGEQVVKRDGEMFIFCIRCICDNDVSRMRLQEKTGEKA